MGKRITSINDYTMNQLLNYSYPGNIRELKNIIERLIVLSTGNVLKGAVFINKPIKDDVNGATDGEIITYKEAKRNFEINYITKVLEKCCNNITHAAELMDLSRRQLFNKIKVYDLN